MTTPTERSNIDIIQNAFEKIDKAISEEIKGNQVSGDARHVNAWSKARMHKMKCHTKMTDLLLKHWEDYDDVVTRGGGGGR